ncbi:6428_t:CDS:1, partial [Scutellospora calospora]
TSYIKNLHVKLEGFHIENESQNQSWNIEREMLHTQINRLTYEVIRLNNEVNRLKNEGNNLIEWIFSILQNLTD